MKIITFVICLILVCNFTYSQETSQEEVNNNYNYIGGLSGDGKREGKGTISFDDGSYYTGFWKNDKREGNGKEVKADGSYYVGEWKEGKKNGKGKFVRKNGTSYSGIWKNNEFQENENKKNNIVKLKQNNNVSKNSTHISEDVLNIIGVYESDEEIAQGVHFYLMLNTKMVFVTATGESPSCLTNPRNWMKTGKYSYDGTRIKFDYGKTWTYRGLGVIDAGGSLTFKWVKGLD